MRPCRRENGLLSTNPSGRHAGKISLVEVALRFSGVTSSTPRPRHPTHPASTLCVHCVFNVGTLRVSCACYAWAMKGTHACPMRQCIHFAAHWRQVLHWPLRRSQVTACHTMHRCRSIHFNAKTIETRTSAPGTMQSTKSHFLCDVQLGAEVHALNRGIAKLQGKKWLQSMVLTST